MPDLNLKVTPVVGDSQYSYTLIHDFLEARIRDEIRVRIFVRNAKRFFICSETLHLVFLASSRVSFDGRSTASLHARLGQ